MLRSFQQMRHCKSFGGVLCREQWDGEQQHGYVHSRLLSLIIGRYALLPKGHIEEKAATRKLEGRRLGGRLN